MRAIAMGLQLKENYFDAMFADPSAWTAMWYYPRHSCESDSWGVGPHTDHEVLTMVLQDEVGGLQVKTDDGVWVDVPPIPGSLSPNIQIQIPLTDLHTFPYGVSWQIFLKDHSIPLW